MVKIRTVDLTKRFGEVVAVDHVSLEIQHGEFFTLLGPSGCGKTTFLRCIAGLELPDEGKVYFDDQDVTEVPPHKRDTGMVFQNYALWPHMSVFDNIAYGLKIRGYKKEEIRKRVLEVLKLVKLEGMENRTPHQLSGGQQQRVALARAIVINPKVLLFDEPLSNLDAKLRIEMRAELKRLQRELGITTLYVTHDQEEAMSISDRIAVMNQGRVMQIGTPQEIYKHPKNEFVARFIGQGTFLYGEVVARDGERLKVRLEAIEKDVLAVPAHPEANPDVGDRVLVMIRPESFELTPETRDSNEFEVEVYHVSFLGNSLRVQAKAGDEPFVIEVDPDEEVPVGKPIKVYVPPELTLAIRL
ncbi:MAG: ABC transporter ATP-binding protein [Thermoproteota archaeon]|nr:MAG: ABC transporter ATP-binding protein [Candidatus Korarchaeota archaeon]